jgi:hypothetical protein
MTPYLKSFIMSQQFSVCMSILSPKRRARCHAPGVFARNRCLVHCYGGGNAANCNSIPFALDWWRMVWVPISYQIR